MALASPIPFDDKVITKAAKITTAWVDWFLDLLTRVNQTARRVVSVALETQIATIATTSVPTGDATAGLFRVTYYAAITTPATTSSELTITLGWTDRGVSKSKTFALINGNTADTTQSDSLLMRCDQAILLTYAALYNSVGGTVMQYSLDVVVESMQ